MKEVRAYIGLGANLGDREASLRAAVHSIAALSKVEVEAVSRIYETDAVGPGVQSAYLNAAVEIACARAPRDLLDRLLEIELAAGRSRGADAVRWGPRTLDLDLLCYGDVCIETPGLTLPHARLHERAFVLEPLCDIAPRVIHPVLGLSISELAAKVRDPGAVRAFPGRIELS